MDQGFSGNRELDVAYAKYSLGDQLSSRAHLYKMLSGLSGPSVPSIALRPASLECLLDIGAIPESSLLSRGPTKFQHLETATPATAYFWGSSLQKDRRPWQEGLLSARWKKRMGDTPNPSFSAWIELFDAYQRYWHGDRNEAIEAWKELALNNAVDPIIKGFASLGVAQVEAENGEAGQLFNATGWAYYEFKEAGNPRGSAQACLLAAEFNYLIGRVGMAHAELQNAATLFNNEGDKKGWAEVNLVAALGESSAGDTDIAEATVRAIEDELGPSRIPLDQIESLAEFSRSLPGLFGRADSRPIELKLAKAREFQRWASGTRDPLLQLMSLRMLSQLLQEGSYWSDASFYAALLEDLSARYRSATPFTVRLQRAALLDYDFLRHTKMLELGEANTINVDFTRSVEVFLASQMAVRAVALEQFSETDRAEIAEIEQGRELFASTLRDMAAAGDDARRRLHNLLATENRRASAESLVVMFGQFRLIRDFINKFHPRRTKSANTITLNQDHFQRGKKNYEIHAEVGFTTTVTYHERNMVEILHERNYLDLLRDIKIGAIMGDDNYVHRGVRNLVAFYELYRAVINPPDFMDEPFTTHSHGGNFGGIPLPNRSQLRKDLIDKAEHDLAERYWRKLVQDAVSDDPAAPDILRTAAVDFCEEQNPSRFLEANFEKDESKSRVDSHQVTKAEAGGKVVLTIKHACHAQFY